VAISGKEVTLEYLTTHTFEGETTEKGTQFEITKGDLKLNWIKYNDSMAKGGKVVDRGKAIKGKFSLDEKSYDGYYFPGEEWNGFAVPYFERAAAREITVDLGGGQLYGSKIKDQGWWFFGDTDAPVDRVVFTGQVIDIPHWRISMDVE
jgi:hypothetical protein